MQAGFDTDSPDSRSWTPIGETSNQLIVYHASSHAIQVVPHPRHDPSHPSSSNQLRVLPTQVTKAKPARLNPPSESDKCPLCGHDRFPFAQSAHDSPLSSDYDEAAEGHYFRVLERAHESSRPGTPVSARPDRSTHSPSSTPTGRGERLPNEDASDLPAMGYYRRFFKEERRLGIGAEGSVFLATHVIGGNVLGQYAVKKIAVGTSKEYLVRILREVRLLEALRHPNIIPYYHSWVDETQFSAFGPPILALHVLMMYATAGNLDSFLLNRSYGDPSQPPQSAADVGDAENIDLLPKAERIKAFKRRRQSGNHGRRGETRGVLLLGLDEILKLFGDVVSGLAFLHSNSILHLDLKCSNVLLHWEEGEVIPKALLSDFGTSEEMLRGSRERSGHTGTMEYMAPETIVTDTRGNWRPSDSHADMWSLGMVLHKLLFLRLPYEFTEDLQRLHVEIVAYPGFEATPSLVETCERRHIPRNVLLLLEKLLHLSPDQRPSAERVRLAIDALRTGSMRRNASRPWRKKATGTGANATDSYRNRSPESSSPIRSLLALPPPSEPVIGTQLLEPTVDMVPQSAVYSFQLARSVVFVLKVLNSLNHCKSASPLRFTLNHGV
ncbi:hypothetical protein CcaverHIS631_0308030 [Cutaneotrichosporon cavernicola]|nr:hypothetical protein CcaverHIS631_0308030 [Cutaneotrichosporon cavernicola]